MPQAEYLRDRDLRNAAEYAFSQHEGEGMAHDLDDAVHGVAAVLLGFVRANYAPALAEDLIATIRRALPAENDGSGSYDDPAFAMGRLLHEALGDDQAPGRWGF